MDIKQKITVKDILKDNYNKFKDKYCECKYEECQEKKRKRMPVMVCSNCDADFYYLGKSKIKEGSYFIDEDELMPF